MKKYLSILVVIVLLAVYGGALSESVADVSGQTYEFGIYSISEFGNVILSVYGNTFADLGFEYGDVITVGIAGQEYEMPVVSSYSDVDIAEMLCRVVIAEDERKSAVILAVNSGDFAGTTGVAEKEVIDAEPGYAWRYDADAAVTITMAQKGGYADQYILRHLVGTTERSDYAELTDEQYANFRMVTAPGIAPYMLYRSSSPIDPSLNRNTEADKALNDAGISSVLNLTDTAEDMKEYADFSETYYAGRHILALPMTMDYMSSEFQDNLAQAVRFIADTEGPWLIHCTHGKDRTGFLCAILECLTGADAENVISDYMESYVNLYHLTVGEEKYALIAEKTIVQELRDVFELPDLTAEGTDLAEEAREYLLKIGLSEEEIDAVLEKLSRGM